MGYGYSRILEGAVQIEIIDKNVKQIWSHIYETESYVDFKSFSISQRAPPVILLWVNKEWQCSSFPKASGITNVGVVCGCQLNSDAINSYQLQIGLCLNSTSMFRHEDFVKYSMEPSPFPWSHYSWLPYTIWSQKRSPLVYSNLERGWKIRTYVGISIKEYYSISERTALNLEGTVSRSK